MKRRFLSIVLVVLLLASLVALTGCGKDKGEADPQDLQFTLKEDGTYAVAAGEAKDASSVVIPATYSDKPVTEIAENGFAHCRSLASVEIPDSITTIGARAFEGCDSLASVVTKD